MPAVLPPPNVLALCAAAAVVSSIALVPSALADLKLCNTTSSRIGVAIGYQDPTGWTTEGWWNISAQTCETLYKGTLSSRFYYIHAIDYDRGGEWAGKSFMCTADKTFTISVLFGACMVVASLPGAFALNSRYPGLAPPSPGKVE